MRHTVLALFAAIPTAAQPTDPLASYFGFEPMRVVSIDNNCGPVAVGDFNGDARPDLAVVNNRKSRIEIHTLRAHERTLEEAERDYEVNELPPNPWYDRQYVSVRHRVGGLVARDADGDGTTDIIYGGVDPAEIVILAQVRPGEFEVKTRRRVSDMSATDSTFAVANVLGDEAPEIITVVKGRIGLFPLSSGGTIGEPTFLGAEGQVAEVYASDFDGDDLADILALTRADETPLRLWLQVIDPDRPGRRLGILPRELRFEMPPLAAVAPVRVAGSKASLIAAIESSSRRHVLYDLISRALQEQSSPDSDREVQAEVGGFVDGSSKNRSVALADMDGDGRQDLLATHQRGNAIVIHRQQPGVGLATGRSFATFKMPTSIAVGQWDGQGPPEVFVLSEEEKTVGFATYDVDSGRLGLPQPLPLRTPGASPQAMQYEVIDGTPTVAIVVKQKRDLALELHYPSSSGRDAVVIELPGITEAPRNILVADADRDGMTDLLLLTPNQPLVMVRGQRDGSVVKPTQVLTKNEMKQFGLVQAAGPDNTTLLDMTGDGQFELVIADSNFVRACAYNADGGWSVVEQINISDSSTQFVGVSILELDSQPAIIAADKAGRRLLMMTRGADGWAVRDRIRLLGFPLGPVFAGSFTGDGQPGVLCPGDEGFAIVRLAGRRTVLDQVSAYRPDHENRREHTLASGDINSDGYTDLVVLDAAEQMCSILSISKSRKILPATEFKVFESRLFFSGNANEFQPSAALIADFTGDAKDDLLLVVHDRLLIYPQMTRK